MRPEEQHACRKPYNTNSSVSHIQDREYLRNDQSNNASTRSRGDPHRRHRRRGLLGASTSPPLSTHARPAYARTAVVRDDARKTCRRASPRGLSLTRIGMMHAKVRLLRCPRRDLNRPARGQRLCEAGDTCPPAPTGRFRHAGLGWAQSMHVSQTTPCMISKPIHAPAHALLSCPRARTHTAASPDLVCPVCPA